MSSPRFTNYLDEISKTPLLTAEEEIELGTIIQTRPKTPEAEAAREKLITANLKLVVSIANDYRSSHVSLEELTAEGNQGLIMAVDRYNPIKFNNRFSTYATLWIQQSIRLAVNRAHTIRTPIRRASQFVKIQQAPSYNEASEHQNLEQLAAETGLARHDIKYCLDNRCYTVSIHQPAFEDAEETIESAIPDECCTVASFIEEEELDMVRTAIDICLNEQERNIVRRRFGLDGQPATLQDLSEVYNVSRERIRKIEQRALGNLREHLENLTAK